MDEGKVYEFRHVSSHLQDAVTTMCILTSLPYDPQLVTYNFENLFLVQKGKKFLLMFVFPSQVLTGSEHKTRTETKSKTKTQKISFQWHRHTRRVEWIHHTHHVTHWIGSHLYASCHQEAWKTPSTPCDWCVILFLLDDLIRNLLCEKSERISQLRHEPLLVWKICLFYEAVGGLRAGVVMRTDKGYRIQSRQARDGWIDQWQSERIWAPTELFNFHDGWANSQRDLHGNLNVSAGTFYQEESFDSSPSSRKHNLCENFLSQMYGTSAHL